MRSSLTTALRVSSSFSLSLRRLQGKTCHQRGSRNTSRRFTGNQVQPSAARCLSTWWWPWPSISRSPSPTTSSRGTWRRLAATLSCSTSTLRRLLLSSGWWPILSSSNMLQKQDFYITNITGKIANKTVLYLFVMLGTGSIRQFPLPGYFLI